MDIYSYLYITKGLKIVHVPLLEPHGSLSGSRILSLKRTFSGLRFPVSVLLFLTPVFLRHQFLTEEWQN